MAKGTTYGDEGDEDYAGVSKIKFVCDGILYGFYQIVREGEPTLMLIDCEDREKLFEMSNAMIKKLDRQIEINSN